LTVWFEVNNRTVARALAARVFITRTRALRTFDALIMSFATPKNLPPKKRLESTLVGRDDGDENASAGARLEREKARILGDDAMRRERKAVRMARKAKKLPEPGPLVERTPKPNRDKDGNFIRKFAMVSTVKGRGQPIAIPTESRSKRAPRAAEEMPWTKYAEAERRRKAAAATRAAARDVVSGAVATLDKEASAGAGGAGAGAGAGDADADAADAAPSSQPRAHFAGDVAAPTPTEAPTNAPAEELSAELAPRTTVPTPYRKVKVPVYSVAGKRVPVDVLLREKILESSKAGSHQRAKAFKSLAGSGKVSGKVDRDGIARTLARFNIDSTEEILDGIMSRFDVDGAGYVDLPKFCNFVLPEDFPAATAPAPGGADDRPATPSAAAALHGKPRPPKDVQQLTGEAGTVERVAALLKEKIREKFQGGGAALRRAFLGLDLNGNGSLDAREFKQMLANFLIVPTEDVVASLFKRCDPLGTGHVTFDAFIKEFIPIDVAVGIEPEDEAKIRSDVHAGLVAPGAALAAAAAANGGHLNFQQCRDALGEDVDANLLRGLKDLADESHDGRIAAAALKAAVTEFESGVAASAVTAAKRDWIDGFGKGAARKGGRAPVAAPRTMTPDEIENRLRDKLMSRSKGGPAELRKAFTHFDKDRSGFITKTQLAEALHDFQMALSPAELDALIARYDSTGTGQISKADFVARLLPADYPTAANRAGQKINGKIAAFFQALTSALAELEEGGSVSRSAAIEAAKRAAKDSSLALPASAAHHAGDVASVNGPHAGDTHTARVKPGPFIAALQVAARAAEEGALADAPPPATGFEVLGGNNYKPPAITKARAFPKRLSANQLEKLVQEKISGKTPAGWSEARYYSRLLDPTKTGVVTFDAFRKALDGVGLATVSDEDARGLYDKFAGDGAAVGVDLFAKHGDAASATSSNPAVRVNVNVKDAQPVQGFVRKLVPKVFVERPEAETLTASFRAKDANAKGTLSVGAIRSVLKKANVEVDDETLHRMMRRCDLGDGEGEDIDYERFAKLVSKPEQKKLRPVSPTPRVNHVVMEEWELRPSVAAAAVAAEEAGTMERVEAWVPPPTAVFEVGGDDAAAAAADATAAPAVKKVGLTASGQVFQGDRKK
jgi:Ca2+-binding EF-hand superfamily protein